MSRRPPPRTLPRTRTRLKGRRILVLLSVCGAVLAGCSSSNGTGNHDPGRFHGADVRGGSLALTSHDMAMRFRSTRGRRTTLATLGSGKLLLLYFGYTHCPDVCPTTMASLGSALRRLPRAEQDQVQVVFVTSDPERDTPSVMKAWLTHFDAGLARPFVGLTASAKQIDAAAKTLHILIAPAVKHKNGTVTVEHGAETIAFRGRKAKVLWSSATAPSDYAADVSQLLGT